jgi:hypothetical protein
MSISYPRSLPLCGWSEDSSFVLDRQQTTAMPGSGALNVAEIGPPMWRGKWASRILDRAKFAEVDAWLVSLRGSLRLFKGRPARHRWPLAYPKGFAGLLVSGSPFSGSGTLTSIGAGRDTITVSTLPVGFVLAPGDWLSIPVGSRQHLHRILEGGTASGGGAVNLTVEPTINPSVTTDTPPAVLLDSPYCEMVLTAQADVVRSASIGGSVSFEGVQVLI